MDIHYHFENSSGPITSLRFTGNVDDPNYYVGAAGSTNNSNYSDIEISGGFAEVGDVISFGGKFSRN